MRLTEEQALQDNMRFANCNALAELKYCGWNIPHRKSITNDEIRFYAWMCRSAVSMLKKQEAVEPEIEVLNEIDRLYRCPRCHKHFFYEKQKYCDECGQAVKWDDD